MQLPKPVMLIPPGQLLKQKQLPAAEAKAVVGAKPAAENNAAAEASDDAEVRPAAEANAAVGAKAAAEHNAAAEANAAVGTKQLL